LVFIFLPGYVPHPSFTNLCLQVKNAAKAEKKVKQKS